VRKSWAPSFMEGTKRIRASLFCCVSSFLVEGASLTGTSCTWTIADLSGLVLRQHTRASLCMQGRIKGALVQWNRQQRREGALTWAHSSWNHLTKLERSLLLVQVPLYLFTCCIPCLRHHIYTHSF
jgi:hypothetical protein